MVISQGVNSQVVFLIMKLCGISIFKFLNQRPSPRLTSIQVILIPVLIAVFIPVLISIYFSITNSSTCSSISQSQQYIKKDKI